MSDLQAKNKQRRAKVAKLIIYGFCLFFIVWIFIAPVLAKLLIFEKNIEKADAIWILGGSGTYIERTQLAAELYKKNISTKIFVVNDGNFGGWNKIEKRNLPFYEITKRELVAQGVDSEAIEILMDNVTGTNFEADLFAKITKERQINSILLVTSSYHSRRALWTFNQSVKKNNLNVEIGVIPAQEGIQTPPTYSWWLSKKGWEMVGGEYVKFVYYWLSY